MNLELTIELTRATAITALIVITLAVIIVLGRKPKP
jgi:hypothetical protein